MIYYLYRLDFENGKVYFGITKNPEQRKQEHLASSKLKKCPQVVHRAIRKFNGRFSMTVLVQGDPEYIRELEGKAISMFDARNPVVGYNIAPGGEISPVAGIGHSQETREKMSRSQKARIRTPEELARMSEIAQLRVMTDEYREKLSDAAYERWARMPVAPIGPEPEWLTRWKSANTIISKEL